LATFQLYWWRKTSGALACIISGTNDAIVYHFMQQKLVKHQNVGQDATLQILLIYGVFSVRRKTIVLYGIEMDTVYLDSNLLFKTVNV
jgi:hypothetical protein